MNAITNGIVGFVWRSIPKNDPARLAIAGIAEDTVRSSVRAQPLTVQETAEFASHNVSEQDLLNAHRVEPVVETADDVRELAAVARIDRRLRRLLFADEPMRTNFDSQDLEDIAHDLEPGDGLDDFIISTLPKWVSDSHLFNAEALLPKLGYLAGAHVLAASSPQNLSDERVLEVTQQPNPDWEHPDEDRQWHQRSHVRDAMYMVATHRPNFAREAAKDPALVQYAMRSPHWSPEFAYSIPGIDLEAGKLTEDASMNTPGAMLSLVWNPKTPVEQAEKIQQIADEGVNNTPFVDDWKITAAAAGRRVESQPWHVEDYETVDTVSMQARLARRIKSGFRAKIAPDRMLNGVPDTAYMWWPKRFEEGLALLTNYKMSDPDWAHLKYTIRDLGPYVTPEGTWSRNQLVEAGLWQEPRQKNSSWRAAARDQSIARLYSDPSGGRLALEAVPAFAKFDVVTQRQAWELVFSLVEEKTYLDNSAVDEAIDTALAVFD